MGRKHRYPLNVIRRDYTYAVCEIAEMYGVTPDTVFRWVREEGLQRVPGSKKYFIHSTDLIAFLTIRNRKNKQPAAVDEIFCCKCRKPQNPDFTLLRSEILPNKTIRVRGVCSICGTAVNKIVSGKIWSESHPFHPARNASTTAHSGECCAPRECQT